MSEAQLAKYELEYLLRAHLGFEFFSISNVRKETKENSIVYRFDLRDLHCENEETFELICYGNTFGLYVYHYKEGFFDLVTIVKI